MNTNLIKRIITAVILIPVVISGVLFLSNEWFAIALGVFVFGGAWEWSQLAGLKHFQLRVGFALLTAGLMWLSFDLSLVPALITGLVFWSIGTIQIVLHEKSVSTVTGNSFIRSVIGLLVLVPAWKALVFMHGMNEDGGLLVLFLMVMIWVADSGAYFAGHKFGKHKLAPATSPGKTWEGVMGALLATAIFAFLIQENTSIIKMNEIMFVVLCLFTTMISVAGDLYESMFKRIVGIKDSGTLIPGHGGVLDRVDSLTAAAPVFVAGLVFLGDRV
ncbi:MAG: phosphatidate cytidylyltransferase [Gammaproteobacteria bacterium]|nr:phosphatidate cytidylyltransferase [Gammaproteobacteria bacterium]MDH5614755.1 phosphatidate cytidylyltransferase [Gammaproteobacteria bacterium]